LSSLVERRPTLPGTEGLGSIPSKGP
jgi:hypothetical protein